MNQKKKNEGSVNHPIGSSAHLLEVPLGGGGKHGLEKALMVILITEVIFEGQDLDFSIFSSFYYPPLKIKCALESLLTISLWKQLKLDQLTSSVKLQSLLTK